MKVYKYWCEPFPSSLPAVRDQFRIARDYRRALVEIENRARALEREILRLEKGDRPRWYAMIRTPQSTARRLARRTASAAGLSSGTYQAVEDAVEQAARTTRVFDDVRAFSGSQTIQVATHQKGGVDAAGKPAPLLVEQLATPNRWVELDADLIGRPRRRGGTGAARLQELRLRIGSDVGRDPVWARFYVLQHRQLPAGAAVRSVRVSADRCGPRSRWSVHFVVDDGVVPIAREDASVVGVDVGWRRMPDGSIRTAYWYGSDGREGSIAIPPSVLARDPKSESLRSIRDRERNTVREQLLAERQAMDPWYLAATTHLHAWTRGSRYVALLRAWRAHVAESGGDTPDALTALAAWASHDRHIWAWEVNNRRRRVLHVGARVRELAVRLAREYGTLAVERTGMAAGLIERPDRGAAKGSTRTGDEAVEERARSLAARRTAVVAPFLIRRELKTWAKKYGAAYVEVDPAWTTLICADCGEVRAVEDRAALHLACNHCGSVEDQDRTAARNLCASGADPTGAGEPLASAKPRKRLRIRRTRKRAEIAVVVV